jgi:hypothetical protein
MWPYWGAVNFVLLVLILFLLLFANLPLVR